MSSHRPPSRANETRTRFAGSLADVSIGDLFQTLEMSAKSSQIEFDTDVGRANVWFKDREVIDAECGAAVGADAIYRLAMADEGVFVANFDKQDHPGRFELAPQRLLMEAARRRDEWLDRVGEGLRPSTRVAVVEYVRAERTDLDAEAQGLLDRVGKGIQLVDLIAPGDDPAFALVRPLRALLASGVLRVVDLTAEVPESALMVLAPSAADEGFWVTAFAAHHLGDAGWRAGLRVLALLVMLASVVLGLAWLSGRVIAGGLLLGWGLLLLGHAGAGLPQLPLRRPLLLLCEPLVILAGLLARAGVSIDLVGRGRALARGREE